LPFREAALFEEAIQRGGGERGRVLARRQGQLASTRWSRCDVGFRA
jgi:hypothetical protein